jgi:hypothetical protein
VELIQLLARRDFLVSHKAAQGTIALEQVVGRALQIAEDLILE